MTVLLGHSILPRRGVTRAGAGLLAAAALVGTPQFARSQCQPAWSGLPELTYGYVEDVGRSSSWPGAVPSVAIVGGFQLPGVPQQDWILEWDGWRWRSALGDGFVSLPVLLQYAVRAATASSGHPLNGLYTAGSFAIQSPSGVIEDVARWAEGEWSNLGSGSALASGSALCATATEPTGPEGAALYVGGGFLAVGGTPANSVARWDGFAWSALGLGITGNVYDLEVYDDDGPGPRKAGLYVIGSFDFAGGVPATNIARWDGERWESLGPPGSGLGGSPNESLAVFDADGPGPQREMLYAGGTFNTAGGLQAIGLARWDGTTWSTVPGWFGAANVKAMAVFDDDGPGPRKVALFVAGIIPGQNIYRWDGQVWSALAGGGIQGGTGFPFVNALCVFDEDGDGPNPGGLYIGGNFDTAGGIATRGIARWGCPLPPRCDANCSGDFHPVTGQHVLTITDFACFQTRYVLSDESADCNGVGGLTIADFGCFQTKFVAGCP